MVKCRTITTETVIEGKIIVVYGLEFIKDNNKTPFKRVPDIFTEVSAIEKLQNKFNDNLVDENHIDDIIEDELP